MRFYAIVGLEASMEAVKRNGYALRYVLVEELFLSIAAKFGIKIDG